jgi:hypothetical protein
MTHQTMDKLFAELETQMMAQFKALTPEQLAEEERRRQIQRDWEAKHTAIETDEDRADKDNYPDEDED